MEKHFAVVQIFLSAGKNIRLKVHMYEIQVTSSLHLRRRKSSSHRGGGRPGAEACFWHLPVGGEITLKVGSGDPRRTYIQRRVAEGMFPQSGCFSRVR